MVFRSRVYKPQSTGKPYSELTRMGLPAFSLNVTLDGSIDHQQGIADDETHAFFTRFPWTNSHHIAADLCTSVQTRKDATARVGVGAAAPQWRSR